MIPRVGPTLRRGVGGPEGSKETAEAKRRRCTEMIPRVGPTLRKFDFNDSAS
jgi:hypothetical protein